MKIERTDLTKAVAFKAFAKDFSESGSWKDAYFELLAWKNTWGFPLIMDIRSTRTKGAYLYLVVPDLRSIVPNTEDMLKNLGYQNIEKTGITVAEIEPTWSDEVAEYIISFK